MTAWASLRRGIRTLAGMGRLCLIFYSALTAAALLAIVPAMMIAYHSLASSTWAAELIVNLNGQWIGELMADRATPSAMQFLPMAAGLFAISLRGRSVSAGRRPPRLFLRPRAILQQGSFFAGCGRNTSLC